MKHAKRAIRFIAVILIALAFTACVEVEMMPRVTGSVSISGTAQVGQPLTANTERLGSSGSISYQWRRGTTNVGTNSSNYTVNFNDVGSSITVTVTRSGNTGSVTSAKTAVVTLPALTGSVSISGTAQVGQTLTVDTWNLGGSGTISYQWRRGGNWGTIVGTNWNYTVESADVGSSITVTVTRSGYAGSVTSETAIIW